MIGCVGLARLAGMVAVGATILATVLATAARAAAAPPGNDKATRPALLQAGAAASRARKWQACIDAYSQAASLEESPAVFGELGLCEEAAGHFASAHPHLKRAVAGIPPADAQRARYQAALGRVAEQVAIVFVTVTPTDARLVVDGRPLGRGEGRNIAVEPGRHVFTALLEGHAPASKTLTVNAREMPHLELSLTPSPNPVVTPTGAGKTPADPKAPKPVAPIPPPVSSVPVPFAWCVPARTARGVLGPVACAGTALFLVSAGTAIGFEVHAMSLKNALDARGFQRASCAPGQPRAGSLDCEEIDARLRQRTDAANVMIGTGIAAAVLTVSAGIAIATEPAGPKVSASVSANGGGILVHGQW